MKRALLVASLALTACVDPTGAEVAFCMARPELCATDAGPTCPGNDDFDGTTWSACFDLFDLVTSDPFPRVAGGALQFDQLGPNNGWSNGNLGSLLSQEVTGNFVAEVRARIVVPTDGGRLSAYSAAALLAMDPAAPGANSRLVSVGTLGGFPDGGNEYGVLSQQTHGSASDFRFDANGNTEAMLRLCRVGASWHAYTRAGTGDPWVGFALFPLDAGFTLPATVRVGPAAYNVGGGTVHVEHDYFRFSTAVANAVDCATVQLP